jgi:hypothetical protein
MNTSTVPRYSGFVGYVWPASNGLTTVRRLTFCLSKEILYQPNGIRPVIALMKSATSLKRLDLHFALMGASPQSAGVASAQNFLRELAGADFLQSLEILNLDGLTCLDTSLIRFLDHCGASLKCLGLRNICIGQYGMTGKKPWLVNLLQKVRKLRLARFDLQGCFWNCGNQRLRLGSQSSDDSTADRVSKLHVVLRRQIEQWITSPEDLAPCPIFRVAVLSTQDDFKIPRTYVDNVNPFPQWFWHVIPPVTERQRIGHQPWKQFFIRGEQCSGLPRQEGA